MTSEGPLRCVLDTGATMNILHTELQDEGAIEEILEGGRFERNEFQVSGVNLGKVSFYPLPIRLPIRIDAILGMDFLSDYLVFIDFRNGQIYFLQK